MLDAQSGSLASCCQALAWNQQCATHQPATLTNTDVCCLQDFNTLMPLFHKLVLLFVCSIAVSRFQAAGSPTLPKAETPGYAFHQQDPERDHHHVLDKAGIDEGTGAFVLLNQDDHSVRLLASCLLAGLGTLLYRADNGGTSKLDSGVRADQQLDYVWCQRELMC
jgi:hypothetical protein